MQIQDAIQGMNRSLPEFRDCLLAQTLEAAPYLRGLNKIVLTLESKIDNASAPRQSGDSEMVWAKWRSGRYDFNQLDPIEVRTLCISPKTAMRPELIAALMQDSIALASFRTFCGFVKMYFDRWRTMENPERVESLIQKMLLPGRIARRSRVLDTWRASLFLFSPQAAHRIGEIVSRDHKPLKDVCAQLFIDTSTPLSAAAYEQASTLAVAALIARQGSVTEVESTRELAWISSNLWTSALGPDAYRSAVAKLIVCRLPDVSAVFQSALVDLIHDDERLGDPRLAYCGPNWRAMPSGAKEQFLAWLAKQTLQFFFDTLVPRNDENRRRAEFWLGYAKRQGKIKDFQVAVSDDDLYRIHAVKERIPTYSSVRGGRTSAFLMVFEGYGVEYVVIEFSETGNAAYIYKREDFQETGVSLRSRSFHLGDDLKRMRSVQERIIHRVSTNERWERRAQLTLAELGIRP